MLTATEGASAGAAEGAAAAANEAELAFGIRFFPNITAKLLTLKYSDIRNVLSKISKE